jgi:hypothetical protein
MSQWSVSSVEVLFFSATLAAIKLGSLCKSRCVSPIISGFLFAAFEIGRLHLPRESSSSIDRLSRYEATPWRQAGQMLYALDNLDRRKPQERMRRFAGGLRDPAKMKSP